MESILENFFAGKRILVIGIGYSNVDLIKQIKKAGPKSLIATDSMSDPTELAKLKVNIESVKEIYPECRFVLGNHDIDLKYIDLAIKSPSVSDKSPFMQRVIDSGIPIETDVSIFFKLMAREKIIGVTGTKGKSTTTTIIYKILLDQGVSATIAGNVGIPVMRNLEEHLNADVAVVELSSFMIHSLHKFRLSPQRMIVTSLGEDHLDFHQTVEQYQNDKLSVLSDQEKGDLSLVNSENPKLKKLAQHYGKHITFYSSSEMKESIETKLRGVHYLANIVAAYRVSKHFLGKNFSEEKFRNTIKHFETLDSRMETRLLKNGIEFINNSKATNPSSFCADLRTLIDEGQSIYILCGGEDKGVDLSEMGEYLSDRHVKKVYVFNDEGGRRLMTYFSENKLAGRFSSVEKAFSEALLAATTDISLKRCIVLMPGTGSYGIFKNKEGSESFNTCVQNLTNL
ncbi:UDP-N-acetylmuramoyl-L-alanine--D-glutamate ligase [bacterium]|nr:UDP-N-acetylmuramoyl-L-alanine--D-glutamate ligase [bacterium]